MSETTTCTHEAVFGGADEERYPCTYAKGHIGPHSYVGVNPPSIADLAAPAVTHPPIHVTTDGDTLWLQCFADNPDAERGEIVRPVEPGDSWWELAKAVDAHIIEHGC